jgi:hypothetical protein
MHLGRGHGHHRIIASSHHRIIASSHHRIIAFGIIAFGITQKLVV